MTKQVQLRRGTTAEHATFTGAVGEVTYDTQKKTLISHDGSTAGGTELARQDLVNVSTAASLPGGLTVPGDLTLLSDASVSGNIDVSGVSTFSAGAVIVGGANTTLVVNGNSRITGTLSIGSSTIVLDGVNDTIYAPKAVFDNVRFTGNNLKTFELNTTVSKQVSVGNTGIVLSSIVGVQTGDKLSIVGIFTDVNITGISSVSIPPYNVEFTTTAITTTVSVGSTVIAVGNTAGVSIGSSIAVFSLDGFTRAGQLLGTSRVVGLTTVGLASFFSTVLTSTVPTLVAVGSTIIGSDSIAGIITGDYVNITGIFTSVPIVGFSSVSVSPYNIGFNTTSISTSVSIGSTIIGIANTAGISIGSSISISGIFASVPVVGFTTVITGSSYNPILNTTTSTLISAGSTNIFVNSTSGVSTGNYIAFNFPDAIIGGVSNSGSSYTNNTYTNVDLLSTPSTTYTVTVVSSQFYLDGSAKPALTLLAGRTYRFDQSAASNSGHPLVFTSLPTGVGFTSKGTPGSSGAFVDLFIRADSRFGDTFNYECSVHGSSYGSTVSVGLATTGTGYYGSGAKATVVVSGGSVSSVSITNHGTGYKLNDLLQLSSTDVGGTGSGFQYTVTGILTSSTISPIQLVSVGSTVVQIGTANTLAANISVGSTATFSSRVDSVASAVLIGSAYTSSQVISSGTTAIFSNVFTTKDAILIGSANTHSGTISTSTTISFARVVQPSSYAVLISTASTVGFALTTGSSVGFSSVVDYEQGVLIGAASTYSNTISVGTTVRVNRFTSSFSEATFNNLVVEDNTVLSGVTTIQQAIIAGLAFTTIDGKKGQVLATDGDGNIGFTTGGGGGGAEVILRVSANTGNDDNDGKTLPVKTIKKATQIASLVGEPTTILVETGEYVEDNPILVYDDVSIIGDSLRNIVVRPLNAGKDLFKVRNGCYITGMTFNDYINPTTGIPQHTYNYSVAFDDPYDPNISRAGYAATSILTITNALYTPSTGITTITTSTPHQLCKKNSVRLAGIAWTCGYDETGISTFVYNNTTGISTITLLSTPGNFIIGNELFPFNLPFSCTEEHAGVTTTIFPYVGLDDVYGAVYPIIGINTAAKTITIQGGISTIPHTYVGYNTTGVSTATYNNIVGIITVTTSSPHGLVANDNITLSGLAFTCNSGAGSSTFPSGNGPYGYTFKVSSATTSTFTAQVGVSTIVHYYNSGGFVKKVPTIQKVLRYPDLNPDGRNDFGVVSVASSTVFAARCSTASTFPHYYTQGGTARLSKPIINKSPYIQNCSILSFLGGNGILVDGNKIADPNVAIISEEGERPAIGDQPDFGKSMVAATFTMVSFGGVGWRTINDGYAQVVSCFQIFCRYASLTQSGGYLSITNSATNFGDFSLRSTGFSSKSFAFDRGRVATTGTRDGLQTLKVIGLGRTDQDLYVLQFLDNNLVNRTGDFKPVVVSQEFNGGQISSVTNIFNIPGHPFSNLDNVVYLGNENDVNPQVISGMIPGNQYYVSYIDASNFRLFQDEGLDTVVTIGSTFVGINTLTKNNQEFFVSEVFDTHSSYQNVSLASTSSTLKFVSGRQVTQSVTGGNAVGYALTFNSSTRVLVVSVESVGGTRRFFSTTGGNISDHNGSPISIGVTAVLGISTYKTTEFKLDSTTPGTVISGIATLPENYYCHFHRPSIINSSGHTWEYSGSGTDYNALPQNGGKGDAATEQISELGGRVYASGTNELGDFKIGDQITAFNRTGNIVFNNKVSIGQLDSIRLSLSGGVAVEEFSTDVNLGENELGGPQNKRVSTQLAVRSFLGNRLGTFIDKTVSANAVPNAVVQLNSNGQINPDLIPPKVVNYNITNVGGGRTALVNLIPAINILQGDTVVEPEDSYVLVNDVLGQYLVLDSDTNNYNFNNGDVITSALAEAVTGVVTAPPRGLPIGFGTTGYVDYSYVGYGTTGLVKGVLLGGTISNAGSGYNVAGVYTGVQLTAVSGVGTQSVATITVGAGGSVTNVDILGGGRYFASGNIVSAAATALGGRTGGSDFQFTINDIETRLYVRLTNNQKFAGSSALADYIADGNAGSISTSLTTRYEVSFTPTDISIGGGIDFINDRIIVGAGHSYVNGDPIIYDANGGNIITVGGLGIVNLATYYVKVVGAGTSVELHRTYQLNDTLDLTGSGTGTHKLARAVINVEEDTFVIVGHGYSTGTPVRVTGSTPVGIDTHAFYYVGSVTTNSFTFHETQSDALFSINGVSFNPIGIASTSTGTITLTKQNVRYASVVNTSSSDPNNWSLLARDSIDASNIVSGVISPTRLGTGSANSDTVLSGTSEYKKAVFSVGIGTTQPLGVTSYTSADLAPGGVGVNTYYGKVNLSVNRAAGTIDTYSTLGVARFKTSTFSVDADGNVSIKNSTTGDIDASTLSSQTASYYLNSSNHTGTIPLTRGGTGQTGAPAIGAILIGNGSAYNLTTTPVFTGNVTFSSALSAWNATTPGLGIGGIHLGAASGTTDAGPAITFGARDSGSGLTAQAGIYINSGGAYGTRMYFATSNGYGVGSSSAMNIDENGRVSITRSNLAVSNSATIATRLTVGSSTLDTGYTLSVNGSFAATTKSFLIDHPTKEGMKLRYGSLEGPENGVYVRGRVNTSIIELPDYWTGLVDESTITVNLTPIGKNAPVHSVVEVKDNKVEISSADEIIDCYYTIFGERKDVEKLEVEF